MKVCGAGVLLAFICLVIFLDSFELLWTTTEVYCLLKLLAICVGVETYLPLNLMLWLGFELGLPFKCLMSLKSLLEFCLTLMSSTVDLHFSFLCLLMLASICALSSAMRGESGLFILMSSLYFILRAASEGISGIMFLILPLGMQVFDALFKILRKTFSAL